MKKIQMNGSTIVHMMPDEARDEKFKEMADLRFKKPVEWREHILSGSEFEQLEVKFGDIVDVPNWWYELNKNVMINKPLSFDKYKNKNKQRRPFNLEESVMHDGLTTTETMFQQPLFQLLEDLDEKKVIKK